MKQIYQRTISAALVAVLLYPLAAAVRGEHAEYVGGTVTGLKQGVQGSLDTSDETSLRFSHQGGEYSLPYKQIVSLEFGQKVGRRVGMATAGFVALGLPGLLILMSKKKKHYLTIGYMGEDRKGQAAVFELAKDTVSNILPALEARTGKRIEREAGEGFDEIGHAATPHIPVAPPVPPDRSPANVTIESVPARTNVIIDTQPLGVTPLTIKLTPGAHYIVLRKDGFENWTRDVTTKASESLSLSADLKAIEVTPNVITVKPSAPKQ